MPSTVITMSAGATGAEESDEGGATDGDVGVVSDEGNSEAAGSVGFPARKVSKSGIIFRSLNMEHQV